MTKRVKRNVSICDFANRGSSLDQQRRLCAVALGETVVSGAYFDAAPHAASASNATVTGTATNFHLGYLPKPEVRVSFFINSGIKLKL